MENNMDLTTLLSSLLSDQNIQNVAAKAGVSTEEAASVLATSLPVLLNGANGQASDARTTESFYQAVTDHAHKDPETIDLEEGGKIVGHLLGDDAARAEDAIATRAGMKPNTVALILAAAAPLIMNMLGSSTSSSNSSAGTASLLSALLGGGTNSNASSSLMTSALTSVLSGALGGQSSSNSLLGSVLSGALGGGMGGVPQQPQYSGQNSGSLLGSLFGGMPQQNAAPSTASLLGSLLGASGGQQQSSGLDLGTIGGLLSSLLK